MVKEGGLVPGLRGVDSFRSLEEAVRNERSGRQAQAQRTHIVVSSGQRQGAVPVVYSGEVGFYPEG